MSINQSYRRVSQTQAREILDGVPATRAQWFGEPDDPGNENQIADWIAAQTELEQRPEYLDINTTWQAIHFLLTGEFCFQGQSQIEGPLKNVTMGGAPTAIETTYGVAHYLDAPAVAAVAAALEPLTVEAVSPLYNAAAFRAARIYPHNERWQDDDLDEFLGEYEQLRAFFSAAALGNQALFIASD